MPEDAFQRRADSTPPWRGTATLFGLFAELALLAVFATRIAVHHAAASAAFACAGVAAIVAHRLFGSGSRRPMTVFFLTDRLVRIAVLSALALGWFSLTAAALTTLAVSGVFVCALGISQWLLSHHPDAKTDATVRAYAFFISAPEEARRLARTCRLISRIAVPWAGFLLWSKNPLWAGFLAQYVLAGMAAHVIDPRTLLKGALRDAPHDLSLRRQVQALDAFAARATEALLGTRKRRR